MDIEKTIIDTVERLEEENTQNRKGLIKTENPLDSGNQHGHIDPKNAGSRLNGYALKTGVTRLIDYLRSAMYPEIYSADWMAPGSTEKIVRDNLTKASHIMYEMFLEVLRAEESAENKTEKSPENMTEAIINDFLTSLPDIAAVLKKDIQAAYEGDPAAKSTLEVMLAYPAFNAISIYRLAHHLVKLGLPLIPRMMTEYAHQMTGIDIHPGASIGPYFFIDHATGVVIGETTVIGSHVKLYQGVTLGAKSFEADENGVLVKGIKRHPNIGNNVVIYAGATILGDISVGDESVIGGNVWLTHSVGPGSQLYYDGKAYQKEI